MATEQSLEERLALYCGTWKFVSCDNFDNYLKELGINVVLRKLAAIASPNVIISVYEDWITMRTETFVKSCTTHFRLNEPFSETTIDDRVVQAEFQLAEGKLIHKQTDKRGRVSMIERTIIGDIMDVRMSVNGVHSAATFRRAAPKHHDH